MRSKSRSLALSAVVAIVLAACRAGATPSPSPSPIVASETHESLRVTLTLEGPPRSAAASWASVTIENVGDRGIRWSGGGCGDPGGIFIDLSQVFDRGRATWPEPLATFKRDALGPALGNGVGLLNLGYTPEARWNTPTMIACPASLQIETLAPGGTLAMRAAWDGTYENAPVPTGPATVEAVLPVIGFEGAVPDMETTSHPVGVSIATAIVGDGGAKVLAPALAIDAALADPEFAGWVSGHDPDRWVNPDVARIGDTWQIGLFKTRGGGATVEYRGVVVDGSGQVVEHKTG